MVAAIDRFDVEPSHLLLLQYVERNFDPGTALRPNLSVEVGEVFRLLAVDADKADRTDPDLLVDPLAPVLGRVAVTVGRRNA